MEIKPFKIRDLTPSKSKIVQETLFKNGYNWQGGSTDIINCMYLFLRTDKLITKVNSIYDFYEKNLPELTFEEFERLYVKGEFVLPEKWCVKVTKENVQECNNWIAYTSTIHIGAFMHNSVPKYSDRVVSKDTILEGYTEITFDQFKRYVLKEDVKEEIMDKDELLKEAKRRYPIGTKYISLDSTGNKVLEQIASYDPRWTVDEWFGGIEVGTGYVYNLKQDKWAEIIRNTLKVEDLVEGEVYNFKNNSGEYIFKYEGNIRCCKNVSNTYYGLLGCFTVNCNSLTVATQEEKQWLEACISANKFIDRETALRSKNMKFEIGKWYKFRARSTEYISRFKSIVDDTFITDTGHIVDGNYKMNTSQGRIASIQDNRFVEVPLSEIQQYLPDGHPDKIKDEWWKTLKKGDVVRCIANPENKGERKAGREYVINYNFDGFIRSEGWQSIMFSEFELVRRANEVEKWSVGTYVVFLIDYGYNNKGTISKITANSTSIVEVEAPLQSDVNERCNLIKDRECKWFPTLKEAEKFSKQLLNKSTKEIADDLIDSMVFGVGTVQWNSRYVGGDTVKYVDEEADELPTFKPVVKNKNYFEKELDIN